MNEQENNLRFRVIGEDPISIRVCGNRDESGIIPWTLAQMLGLVGETTTKLNNNM